jgi:hypothetical protein
MTRKLFMKRCGGLEDFSAPLRHQSIENVKILRQIEFEDSKLYLQQSKKLVVMSYVAGLLSFTYP